MELIAINTPEWLAARKIGSSDAAAILGVNPYRTPYQVWAEKIGAAMPKEPNEAMRWGQLLEPVIAGEFAARTGLKVEKNLTMKVHPELDWMTATADFFCWDNNEFGLLEIKNVNAYSKEYDEESISDSTSVQIMHQMAVYGLSWAYCAYLVGGNKLLWQKTYRSEPLIAKIIEEEKKFWRLVEEKTPPPFSGGDGSLLDEMYPTSNRQAIQLDTSADRLAKAYLAARVEVKHAESKADDHSAKLKAKLGGYEMGYAGSYRISWKSVANKNYRKFTVTELKNV
jgi:putative phage-type endonuclease